MWFRCEKALKFPFFGFSQIEYLTNLKLCSKESLASRGYSSYSSFLQIFLNQIPNVVIPLCPLAPLFKYLKIYFVLERTECFYFTPKTSSHRGSDVFLTLLNGEMLQTQ